MMTNKFRLKAAFILWPILLGLLFIYCYRIDNIPFVRVDDGGLMEASRTYALRGYLGSRMFETGHNESRYFHVHPPFFYLLNGLVFKLIGFGILQARLLSLMCAFVVLAVAPFLYWLMVQKRLMRDDVLLLVVMFLSNPFYFIMARYVRPEMVLLLVTLLSILFYYLFSRKGWYFLLIISGVLAGLSFLTHFYGIYAFMYIIIMLLFSRKAGKLLDIILFGAGFILPLIPYAVWVLQDFNSFYYQLITARQSFESFRFGLFINRYTAFLMNHRTLNSTILFLFVIGAAYFKRKHIPHDAWAVIGRGLVPILCFFAVFMFITTLNGYYYLTILPFIYFIVIYLKERIGLFAKGLMVVFIVVNLLGLGFYWQCYNDYNYYGYTSRIKAVLPKPNGFAVLGNMSLYPGLLEYEFYGFENASLAPPTNTQTYAGFANRVKELNIQYIIYQESNFKQPFHARYLARYLNNRCRLFGKVFDPCYGSEGQKKDNYIYIYRVIQ